MQPPTRVIDDEGDKRKVLEELHDRNGHKGRESTFYIVSQRYWWKDRVGFGGLVVA